MDLIIYQSSMRSVEGLNLPVAPIGCWQQRIIQDEEKLKREREENVNIRVEGGEYSVSASGLPLQREKKSKSIREGDRAESDQIQRIILRPDRTPSAPVATTNPRLELHQSIVRRLSTLALCSVANPF